MELRTFIKNAIETNNNANTGVKMGNFCGTVIFEGTDKAANIAARVAFCEAVKAAFPDRAIKGHLKYGSKTWRKRGRFVCGCRIELTEAELHDIGINGSYHWSAK